MLDELSMQATVDIINEVLDPIGIVIGLIISVPIFWTWYDLVLGRRRRFNKWRKHASSYTGELKAILIIDLLSGKDMSNQVERYITSQQETLGNIPKERRVHLNWQDEMTPENAPDIARRMQEEIASLQGIDELHVFYGGPTTAAAMLGAELANIGCKVMLYQNDRNQQKYVNFGPLRYPHL